MRDRHPDCTLDDLAEHVLRISADFQLATETLRKIEIRDGVDSAVGRLVSESNRPLRANTPLASLLENSHMDPQWRDKVQSVPSSLWSELETMRSIYGTPCNVAPASNDSVSARSLHHFMEEILSLRGLADSDLMGLD